MDRQKVLRALFWPFSDTVIDNILINNKRAPLDPVMQTQLKGFGSGLPEIKTQPDTLKYMPGDIPKMMRQMNGQEDYTDSETPSETRIFIGKIAS